MNFTAKVCWFSTMILAARIFSLCFFFAVLDEDEVDDRNVNNQEHQPALEEEISPLRERKTVAKEYSFKRAGDADCNTYSDQPNIQSTCKCEFPIDNFADGNLIISRCERKEVEGKNTIVVANLGHFQTVLAYGTIKDTEQVKVENCRIDAFLPTEGVTPSGGKGTDIKVVYLHNNTNLKVKKENLKSAFSRMILYRKPFARMSDNVEVTEELVLQDTQEIVPIDKGFPPKNCKDLTIIFRGDTGIVPSFESSPIEEFKEIRFESVFSSSERSILTSTFAGKKRVETLIIQNSLNVILPEFFIDSPRTVTNLKLDAWNLQKTSIKDLHLVTEINEIKLVQTWRTIWQESIGNIQNGKYGIPCQSYCCPDSKSTSYNDLPKGCSCTSGSAAKDSRMMCTLCSVNAGQVPEQAGQSCKYEVDPPKFPGAKDIPYDYEPDWGHQHFWQANSPRVISPAQFLLPAAGIVISMINY